MTFRIGSLFSGIGGLELGLERALAPLEPRVVWQVERDPFCRRVLARHWPDADRSVEDVTLATASNLARVDLICGGFPCQDVSVAGRGAGLDGARSGLWYEYARIVRELAPRFVVVENVASGVGRWLDPVCDQLDAMGYYPRPWAISAADVGAPHRRERVFIVAHASDADRELVRQQRRRRGARRAGTPEFAINGGACDVADANGLRQLQPRRGECGERGRAGDEGWWAAEPDVGRVAHGVPARVDRLRALGNAVVPQCAEAVGRVVLAMIRAAEAA